MAELLKKAAQLASDAHAGQVDKGGNPYIDHPAAVADKLVSEDEKIVALLHDTVEDTYLTLATVADAGFPENIVHAIDCLTKRSGEAYEDYLRRIRGNHLARAVKIADIEHNMDLSRLKTVNAADRKRLEKYKAALLALRD